MVGPRAGRHPLRRRRPGDGRASAAAGRPSWRRARAPPDAGARRRGLGAGRRLPRGRSPPPTTRCSPSAGCSMGERLCVHGAAGGVGHRRRAARRRRRRRRHGHRARPRRSAAERGRPRRRASPSSPPRASSTHGPFDVDARAGRRAQPPRRPRSLGHRRPHLGDRRGRRAPRPRSTCSSSWASGPGSTARRCGPGRSRRRPTRPGASSATCSPCWPTARLRVPVARHVPDGRGGRRLRARSRPAASSARSSSP